MCAPLSFNLNDNMKKLSLISEHIFIKICIDRFCWPLNGLFWLPYVNQTATHTNKLLDVQMLQLLPRQEPQDELFVA